MVRWLTDKVSDICLPVIVGESLTITGKQMSETLSVSQRTIERDISALQKLGVLKREGKDNDGMWVINVG